MTGFDGKLVIVLDHLADRYGPGVLPVSAVHDGRGGIEGGGQFDGGPPTLVSLDDYDANPKGSTRLVDVRSGDVLPARLYRLHHRTEIDA